MKLFLVIPIAVIFISGCIGQQSETSAVQQAKTDCIDLCLQQNMSSDLSNGPCLSNAIADGWVCDVAHSPRTAVDDRPENQCSAFGKTAQHFVEVDTDCNFIRGV
ncbi:MAG: hypothetical protein HZB67_02515 [Candidatus Aenigmarchaeota archaeon]|nr:hypothetical protein [Candidatus Aenigmarchaeota archaeon]